MTKLLLFFKTTTGRNVIKLFISVIRNKLECLSLESVYQPCLKFATKSTVYLSVAVERCSTPRQATDLRHIHQIRLERLARDKHSSLLRKLVNYGRKKFYEIGPRCKQTQLLVAGTRASIQQEIDPIRKDCFQVKSNLLTDFRFTTHMNIMILN